jgi:hypothetical protein
LSQSAIFNETLVRGLPGLPPASANINALNGTLATPMTAVDGMKQLAKPWYSDQILPFDITLAGASELGAATAMRIYGVEILNEGSGVSIDDAVTEMQATFVARTRCSGENDFLPLADEGRGRSRVTQHGRGGGVVCAFYCSDRTSASWFRDVVSRPGASLYCAAANLKVPDAMTVAAESGRRASPLWLSVLPDQVPLAVVPPTRDLFAGGRDCLGTCEFGLRFSGRAGSWAGRGEIWMSGRWALLFAGRGD